MGLRKQPKKVRTQKQSVNVEGLVLRCLSCFSLHRDIVTVTNTLIGPRCGMCSCHYQHEFDNKNGERKSRQDHLIGCLGGKCDCPEIAIVCSKRCKNTAYEIYKGVTDKARYGIKRTLNYGVDKKSPEIKQKWFEGFYSKPIFAEDDYERLNPKFIKVKVRIREDRLAVAKLSKDRKGCWYQSKIDFNIENALSKGTWIDVGYFNPETEEKGTCLQILE